MVFFLLIVLFVFVGCEENNIFLDSENESFEFDSVLNKDLLIEECKISYGDFGQSTLDICYIQKAMEHGIPSLCDEALEEKEEEIINCKAIASRDKDMCLDLESGSEVQNRCYSNLARILDDSSYCDYIDERFCPHLRNICLSQFR